MILTFTNPPRLARGGSLSVEDFADIPGCLSVGWNTDGLLAVEFDRDLTVAEQATVARRVQSLSVNEETVRAQAEQALANNQTFLAIASPTGAQIVAQTQALTRQVNGLIRLVLNRHD